MTMTRQELHAAGYRVVDGKAVRVTEQGLGVPPEKRGASAPAPRSPYRSKWEAERATIIEAAKRAGKIREWRYEAVRLKLAEGAWYKCDFVIWHNDGTMELQEVKGYWREA